MTTKDEALRMALDALDSVWNGCVNSPIGEAVAACKAALAEPAPELACCGGDGSPYQPCIHPKGCVNHRRTK